MGDQVMPEGSPQPDGEWDTLFRTGGMAAVQRVMEGNVPVPYDIPDGYRILKHLGEGGMGTVFLAQRSGEGDIGPLALKLIHPWLLSLGGFRERFARERQALAVLEGHSHIVHLKDAGTTKKGIPFLATDYVEGEPVTKYCDRKQLGIDDRLRLFSGICDAVQYAHLRLIVHSDITPRNILISENGAPKLLDFGLAKLLDGDYGANSTTVMPGGRPLTPAYASPEQVMALPVTIPSDVYQLGVVLYELLTGCSPHPVKADNPERVLQVIREVNPARASEATNGAVEGFGKDMDPKRRKRKLRGDLDNILAMALRKDPKERYGSVERFAADIGHYLRNERVSAVPPSAAYRTRKFARRYRRALTITAAFVLVLIAAAAISIRQSIRANREAAVAQAVNDFLRNDLLAQASASTQASPSTKPDPDLKVRTALDRAAVRIVGKFDRQPEVEAAIRDTMGQTYMDLGLYPESQTQLERALELGRRASGAKNPKTLKTISRLGNAAFLQGKYPEAEALDSQALEIQRRLLGRDHPDTLDSMSSLAAVYYSQGKYPQAEVLERQTLEIRRRVLGLEHRDTLASLNDLANVYYFQGKYAQAEPLYSQTFEIWRRILGPEHPRTLRSMNNLALDYEALGKYAQAEALHRQTLEIMRRVLGPEHPDTLVSMNSLGRIYDAEGKYALAEALYRQALEIRRRVLGAEHPDTLASMNNLAMAYDSEGKYALAEALHRQALEIRRRVLGAEHPDTLASMSNLAMAYDSEGKYALAETLYTSTLQVLRRVLGPEHDETLIVMNNLADVYAVQGRYTQAAALFTRTLEISRQVRGAEHPSTLIVLMGLASMYQRQGNYGLAEAYAQQTLTGRRHALGSEQPDTMTSAADLSLANLSRGKAAESEALARESLHFYQQTQPEDWQRFRAESLLGASLAGQKKYAEAEPFLLEGYQGMLARKERMAVPDWYHLDRAREWTIQLYLALGQPKKAAEWRKEVGSTRRTELGVRASTRPSADRPKGVPNSHTKN
jgi:serine/threonine protein kinase/tetratricopeptide (TPR) repeat protein